MVSRLSVNTPTKASREAASIRDGDGGQGSEEVSGRAAEVGGTEEELGGQQGGSLGSWRLATEEPTGRAVSSAVSRKAGPGAHPLGTRAAASSSGCLWAIFRGAFS